MAAEVLAKRFHLFAPQEAWRFRWNKNTDTPLPPDEPAGQNPPDGALVHYYLRAEAKSVALEILDGTGVVVRRYASDDPPEPLVEGRNIPDYWIRPHRPLLKSPGLHRFVWDVHHERPAVASFSYPIAAIAGNTPRVPLGSWALPGTYQVRLTVDGLSETAPLVVKMDPRVKASAAEIRLQYETSRAIDAGMRRAAAALAEVRAAAAKNAQLAAVEQRISRASQPLGQLFGNVEGADAAPTPAMLAAWKNASSALDAALAEWEKVKAGLR
jgi:hypothetical protein